MNDQRNRYLVISETILVVELNRLDCVEDCQVIAQPLGAHVAVLEDPLDRVLLVAGGLGILEPAGVPLANTDDQLVVFLESAKFVGGCDDLDLAPAVVVVEAAGDEGTAADKVVVAVDEDARPGELAGAGLGVRQAGGRPVAPGAALPASALPRTGQAALLVPRLLPWSGGLPAGRPAEGAEVQLVGVVAADTVAGRAGFGRLRVSGAGKVGDPVANVLRGCLVGQARVDQALPNQVLVLTAERRRACGPARHATALAVAPAGRAPAGLELAGGLGGGGGG